MTIARLVAVLASFAVAACNKSDAKQEAPKAACPQGFFTDPAGRFCAKLPAGYKIVEDKNGPGYPSAILNDDNDTRRVTIVFAPPDQFDTQLKVLRMESEGKATEQLDIADGAGKYATIAETQVGMELARAVVRGTKNTLLCQATWAQGASTVAVDICKSLRAQN